MPGKKQRHDFVVELAIGHANAFVVLNLQEHAEQISRHLSARAALFDDAVDHFVEAAYGAFQKLRRRERNPGGQEQRKPGLTQEFPHQHAQRRVHVLRFVRNIRVEQRLGHDAQREMHHGFVDVERLPVAPGRQHALR